MQKICPVCNNTNFIQATKATGELTPYHICQNCQLWAQFPVPEFKWESELQPVSGKDMMNDYARATNDDLANRLTARHTPKSVLDVGSKYPYLLHCFKKYGVEDVLGIDGCESIELYGTELDVPVVKGDFLTYNFGDKKFDLICLVHCIEHFADPIRALNKITSLLTDRGVVYIRTPDTSTKHKDQHLTDEHYQVHPILFSRSNFQLAANRAGLSVFDEWIQHDLGQTDWQLRKIEKPRISFAVVSCNEEEVIERMLNSIIPLAWEVVVYLNNCTDSTPTIIQNWSKRTEIPIRILEGYWDNNFARARNEAIFACEGTHVAWMDCDDVLSPDAPALILDTVTKFPDSPQDWRLIYGGDTFFHLRLWKNEPRPFKPHFHDRCHEYVALGDYQHLKIKCDNITLQHIPKPKDATTRNLNILKLAKEEGPQPCAHCPGEQDSQGRTLFYLGNSYREGNFAREALECYDAYLINKCGWHDEIFWAWMYKGYCHQALNEKHEAIRAYAGAIGYNPHWAEAFMALARLFYLDKNYHEALRWSMHASSLPLPDTLMFISVGCYQDQPWRLMSWCAEHLGHIEDSIKYGEMAAARIGGPDKDWEERLNRLRSLAPKQDQLVVQVMRPGAHGDLVMTTAACKGLKEKGYFVRYVCHPASRDIIQDNLYIDEVVLVAENNWQKMLDATSSLRKDKVVYFQYPMTDGYPDKPIQKHLVHYFCEQAEVAPTFDLSVGLTQEHINYGKENAADVVIHTTAGWSPLKNWPIDKWEALVKELTSRGYSVVQIGGSNDTFVNGAKSIKTPSIRHGVAIQKFSKVFVGVDSVFNHTSQAINRRSVIIWGSTHPHGSGYEQNINMVNGKRWTRDMGTYLEPTLPCQPCYREYNHMSAHPKPPCPNLVKYGITTLPSDEYPEGKLNACMANNSLDSVLNAILEILSEEK